MDPLVRRSEFSEFYENILRENANLSDGINNLETYFNSNKIFYFHYGGRMWNYIVHKYVSPEKIEGFSDIQKSAILKGNHDMLAVVPDNIYDHVFHQVTEYVTNIKKAFEQSINRHKTKVVLDYDKKDAMRTITIGRSFRIYLRNKSYYTRASAADNDTSITIEDQDKLLFYLELGRNREGGITQCIYTDVAEKIMIERVGIENKAYLNVFGLIMMSQFLNVNRDAEKGAPIDAAREVILKDHLLDIAGTELTKNVMYGGAKAPLTKLHKANKTVRLHKYKSRRTRRKFKSGRKPSESESLEVTPEESSPEVAITLDVSYDNNALLYITLVLFPSIFNTKHFILYNNVRGIIMEKIFILYDSTVKKNIETLDSYLLDNPGPDKGPSLRQIIILFITHLSHGFYNTAYNNKYSLQLSGGDVFRLFIDDIKQTSDIDAKLMKTTKSYIKLLQLSFVVCTLIVFYLHQNNYFRIKDTFIYNINIGDAIFKRYIHTIGQEIIPTSRMLPHFVVPLVSIDLKLNGYIKCPKIHFQPTIFHRRGFDLNSQKIAVVHSSAPLDISLITTKIIDQRTNCQSKEYFEKNFDYSNTFLPTTRENTYCIPPYPSINYLIDDLEHMIESNMRPNKKDKDLRRLRQIHEVRDQIRPYDKLEYKMNRMLNLLQANPNRDVNIGEDKQVIVFDYNKYKQLNDIVYDFVNVVLSNNTRENIFSSNIDTFHAYKTILSGKWFLSTENEELLMHVLKGAKLNNKHIESYSMPHSIDRILNEMNSEETEDYENDNDRMEN